jgi:hypothetical protein
MRDLVVREAIKTMTRDAAKRFRELLGSGAELPYDVRESGDGSPMPQYVPLTERFIRENAAQLRELDSFGAACAALESAELAGPYLERLEIAVPPESRRRAELAAVVFLCRLWLDCTDFSLGDERLNPAIEELEAGGELEQDEIEVIVPLRGLQMPVERLELATAIIVSADTVEVPAEARVAEGAASAGWEPTFLAVACVGMHDPGDESAPDAGARAVEAFRQVITALRLFKPGGVGLGAHAWARTGHDRWRRIATGAGRPRPGGYRLTGDEIGELVAFSRALAHRSTPFGRPAKNRPGQAGALARSISRFEAGLERHAVLEALNDYLLAMRFLLEGAGPADLGLPMRVAALCSEPERRDQTKAAVDRALALERELWTGEPAPTADGALSPAAVAVAVEELARAILKDAACGHLGSDLRTTADEILLADGLSVGEGAREQRGATAEWDLPEPDEPIPDDDGIEEQLEPQPVEEQRAWEEDAEIEWGGRGDLEWGGPDYVEWGEPEEAPVEDEGRLKVPEPTGRISVERNPELEEENVLAHNHARAHAHRPEPDEEHPAAPTADDPQPNRSEELLAARPAERQRIADRVAYLFPRPETTEWSVREVAYDRTRRADVRHRRAS